MADTNSNDAGNGTFTAGETKLLMSILKNLEGDLAADWDTVAVELSYKDGKIAKQRWGQIRRKKIANGASPTTAGVTKKAPVKKTAPKSKSVKAENDDDDAEEAPAATPVTAKARGKGKAAKNTKSAEKVKEEDEAGSVADLQSKTKQWVTDQAKEQNEAE